MVRMALKALVYLYANSGLTTTLSHAVCKFLCIMPGQENAKDIHGCLQAGPTCVQWHRT